MRGLNGIVGRVPVGAVPEKVDRRMVCSGRGSVCAVVVGHSSS